MTTVARAQAPMAGDRNNVDTAVTMEIGRYNKRVLLTAAGFSRNYGGGLAREMWEDIFSHPEVQRRPQLRTLLIRTPQFEDALAEAAGAQRRSHSLIPITAISSAVTGAP
jgi:hypothetical protein